MQQSLAAGDTLSFSVTLADYPASAGWVLHYRLVPRAGGSAISITGTASGDDHAVSVAAGTTATWAAGAYACGAWVINGAGERHSVASESGQITIAPDPATLAAGTDTRSSAQLALAAVQASLTGKATTATQRYKINNREVYSYTLAELIQLEKHLQLQVANEQKAAGLMNARGTARRIFVRAA